MTYRLATNIRYRRQTTTTDDNRKLP